jgi:hypothetical protein
MGTPPLVCILIAAISSRHHDRLMQCSLRGPHPWPLVLFLTGPTGAGKTEMARQIAAALLTSRVKVTGGDVLPEGLVELRGQDFADAARGGMSAMQEAVRHAVALELYRCRGQAVLIFDEAQKSVHKVLDGGLPLSLITRAVCLAACSASATF